MDVLAALVDGSVSEKQKVLGARTLKRRLQAALPLIRRQIEVLQMSNKIQNKVEGNIRSSQREFYLRQQLKAIKEELAKSRGGGKGEKSAVSDFLGEEEEGEGGDEVAALVMRLKTKNLPPGARKMAGRELKRLRRMQPMQPEYSVILTYLEWIADLPWGTPSLSPSPSSPSSSSPSSSSPSSSSSSASPLTMGSSLQEELDIDRVKEQLDADHYGLEKVKRRIVEYIAVRGMRKAQGKDMAGPILCLVGPPGTGKTSLGRSVAKVRRRDD